MEARNLYKKAALRITTQKKNQRGQAPSLQLLVKSKFSAKRAKWGQGSSVASFWNCNVCIYLWVANSLYHPVAERVQLKGYTCPESSSHMVESSKTEYHVVCTNIIVQ